MKEQRLEDLRHHTIEYVSSERIERQVFERDVKVSNNVNKPERTMTECSLIVCYFTSKFIISDRNQIIYIMTITILL